MYADMQADAITTSRSQRLQNESISGSGSTTNNAITNNITVNAAQGQSVREIADAVSERLNFEYQKKKGCWA
jgi:cytochrome c-type biogenesis protein CcmH/NrfF